MNYSVRGGAMKKRTLAFIRELCAFLPAIFWGLLIYGFDAPYVANLTLLSALLHEIGHITVFSLLKRHSTAKSTVNGLRLTSSGDLSYREELAVTVGGPLINIVIGAVLFIIFPRGRYGCDFAVINFLTAASNLLPTKGSDGYRIIKCSLSLIFGNDDFLFLDITGAVISIFIMLTSLLLMLIIGEGYWIYGLFLCNTLTILEFFRKRRTF